MTELMEKAIKKIDSEAEKAGKNGKLIAQYIIDNLIYDDESAEKILSDKKTFVACMNEVKKKAKQQASDGMAMVEDFTVFEWVRNFFDVQEKPKNDNILNLSLADLI